MCFRSHKFDFLQLYFFESQKIMSSTALLRCTFCGLTRFKSKYGLNQHQKTNMNCVAIQASLKLGTLAINHTETTMDIAVEEAASPAAVAKTISGLDELLYMEAELENAAPPPLIPLADDISVGDTDDGGLFDDEDPIGVGGREEIIIDCGGLIPEDSPEMDLVKEFRSYCSYGKQHFAGFSKNEKFHLEMLDLVYEKGAPLDIYEAILETVYKRDGTLGENKTLKSAPHYISKQKLLDAMALRYRIYPKANREKVAELKAAGEKDVKLPSYFLTKEVYLPHRQAKVPILYHPFPEEFVHLMTDPRVKDSDWDFFNNDPLAPPPTEWKVIGNANTGTAFRCTWKDLVKNPGKEVAWGVVAYMDATATAVFSDLNFHAVKFSFVNLTEEVS